jgi:hypothetical protein
VIVLLKVQYDGGKMDRIKKIFRSEHAQKYDQKAAEAKWLDPAVVFGLTYRFVKPGDCLTVVTWEHEHETIQA